MSANQKRNRKRNHEQEKTPNDVRSNKIADSEQLDETFDIEEDGNLIVEMTDEEGNVYLYEEEMIIPIDDKKFALLVALPFETEEDEHHHEHGCDCGCEEEDVIIAKIVTNEDGEEEYIEPSDEEFEIVRKAYDDFFNESLEEEQAKE